MTARITDRASARTRLLDAANELFYAEGVNTVGIDRVIDHAGVAKATLYSAFGSKDGLIRAYLTVRQKARQEQITARLAELDDPRRKLLGVFEVLGESFSVPDYHGCAFVNASAEAGPDSPILEVTDAYRTWIRTLFTDLGREAGATDPQTLARQLVLVYDGASITARIDHYPATAEAARQAAEVLIDAALAR
jgi:AcrR family transcriptional regulator